MPGITIPGFGDLNWAICLRGVLPGMVDNFSPITNVYYGDKRYLRLTMLVRPLENFITTPADDRYYYQIMDGEVVEVAARDGNNFSVDRLSIPSPYITIVRHLATVSHVSYVQMDYSEHMVLTDGRPIFVLSIGYTGFEVEYQNRSGAPEFSRDILRRIATEIEKCVQ